MERYLQATKFAYRVRSVKVNLPEYFHTFAFISQYFTGYLQNSTSLMTVAITKTCQFDIAGRSFVKPL